MEEKIEILLINPKIRENKEAFIFPLGLGYIARILSNEGYNVSILDIDAFRYTDNEIISFLRKKDFDVYGITGMTTEYKSIKWLSSVIKQINPNSKIILGGALATTLPEFVLEKTEIDIVIIGEGEETIKNIMNNISKNRLRDVKGIYFKEKNKIYKNQPQEQINDLDNIPFPDRDLFSLDKYIKSSYLKVFDNSIKTLNIVSSRGCPYNCIYCSKAMWGQKYRFRSADNIIKEIEMLKEKYNINGIQFVDDLFVLNRERVFELCDKIIQKKLDIKWIVNGRVNLMDFEMLKKMKGAGCKVVSYGIESGNIENLKFLNKQVSVEQAKKAVLDTWKAGILPHGYLIIGTPNETKETVSDTIKFCNETSLVGKFSFLTPIPGTELYNYALKEGKIKTDMENYLLNWPEWNDGILVNLTSLTDEELIKLKREAERKILLGKIVSKFYRHLKVIKPLNIIKEGLDLLKSNIK